MNKYTIIFIAFSFLLLSCNRIVDLGAVSLGEEKPKVIDSLKKECGQTDIISDNTVRYIGQLQLFDIYWEKVLCIFDKDKLVEIKAYRPYKSLSTSKIKSLKDQLRKTCGSGFNSQNPNDLIACYGDTENNNGCLGAILIDLETDTFFMRIYLSDYAPKN